MKAETFVARWEGRGGGQERANYALFLSELCDVLGVPRPEPAAAGGANDYVFERVVSEVQRDGSLAHKRIDLYKRGCFVLEAKQSRQRGATKEVAGDATLFGPAENPRRRSAADRAWDVLMMNARRQAEDYVRLLPPSHPVPPFVIVCDVGHCLELYANFRGDARAYDQFPNRSSFRIHLDDLKSPEVRARLAQIFDPERVRELDPTRHAARVTRGIAQRLAAVSKALEAEHHAPHEVAAFLTRVIFTMFAEDAGLLPPRSFSDLLLRCESDPDRFEPMLSQLWQAMDSGGFAHALERQVLRFNGEFFKERRVLRLGREEIGELRAAAEANWREVEPAIFGTLLEQALDPKERRRLGAHYTPRPYVERLVTATVIEPLRADWTAALATAERQKAERRDGDAAATVRAFHDRLCATRVLDPACGTGNFLYVALEMMKRLEGEVLEALSDLGGQEALLGLEGHTVDPHQFLGLEINPRAAAIAELVLWIGYLQWHFRHGLSAPAEPILRAFGNIRVMDAVLAADRPRDGAPYPNPRRPAWPEADFIVGNPPFVGGKDLRSRLGAAYAQALWHAHPHMNESADFVMYWWDRAAELLRRESSPLRRFGFVTTNSISQVFQRRVIERHMSGRRPLSLVMAVPDHPWTKASRDAAAIRIAMTVAAPGIADGVVREVAEERELDTDVPAITLGENIGRINADLTIGADVTLARSFRSNAGLSSPGVKLHGAGFIVTPQLAAHLGLGRRPGLDKHLRAYRNGRDLTARPRGVMVIDLFGLSAEEVRGRFPEVYQYLSTSVRPAREAVATESPTTDSREYAKRWWIFGKPRPELRSAVQDLRRYIATVETAKHRVFQFLDADILPDNMLVAIASDDAAVLGVLSSRIHTAWALRAGGWLGIGNDPRYSKSRCFDPFPLPDASLSQRASIAALAERLDAHRKSVLAAHPHLTLTALYNVLERLRAGVAPDALGAKERRVFDDGLILILKEFHEALDEAVAEAYGWPADLAEAAILARLVALNRERVEEERRGFVRWLRPDYQIPRFGTPQDVGAAQREAELVGAAVRAPKPLFPPRDTEQTIRVMAALAVAPAPLAADAIAAAFRGRRVRPKVDAVLASLVRMGVAVTADGRFAVRRLG